MLIFPNFLTLIKIGIDSKRFTASMTAAQEKHWCMFLPATDLELHFSVHSTSHPDTVVSSLVSDISL